MDSDAIDLSLTDDESDDATVPNRQTSDGEEEIAPVKAFDLNSAQFFLTYPRCTLSKEEVLQQLSLKPHHGIDKYVICQEQHKDGEYHIHVYLKLLFRKRTRSATFWDLYSVPTLSINEDMNLAVRITWHGHYESCRSPRAVKKYCKKDGNFLTNCIDKVLDKPSESMKHWTDVVDLTKENKIDEACKLLWTKKPRDMCLHASNILTNLQSLNPPTIYQSIYQDWVVPCILTTALNGGILKKKSLVLFGPPGWGKTCYARSLFPNHLFVTHLDCLKQYNGEECLIFDDMEFGHLPRSTNIYVCDVEQERTIHCRFSNALIPAGVKRIFCTNKMPCEMFKWEEAIDRRCYCIKLVAPLFLKDQ